MPYIPGRKAAAQLGIHQNTLRRYADEGQIRVIRTKSGQRRYDVDAYLGESADAALVCYCRVSSTSKGKISKGRSLSCGKDTLKPKLSKISAEDSTGSEKDLSPYWSDFTAAISSELWLPIETGSPDSGSSLFSGLPSKTAAGSWFSTTRTTAPNRELTEDILAILHTFSCRLHGLRRYRNAIKEDPGLSDKGAAPDTPPVV